VSVYLEHICHKKQQATRENYVMRSLIVCIIHQKLYGGSMKEDKYATFSTKIFEQLEGKRPLE